MIVKREYVRLKKLFETDKECEAVFLEAAGKSYDEDRRKEIVAILTQFSLYEREMGWCMSDMASVVECFERLDREKPYDSGLLPSQTCKVEVLRQDRRSVLIKLMDKDGEIIGVKRIYD